MATQTDSFVASLIWGRVGAAVLALVAFVLGLFGYQLGLEDQSAAVEIVSSTLAGIAGVMALVSKIRETKKVKQE
jgi:ABC-type nickel/cobalt efflux system permease component RcnA